MVLRVPLALPSRALVGVAAALVRLRANGLRAVLVSDPLRTHTALSVDLAVGAANDPVLAALAATPNTDGGTLLGLSHLVEHLLFMGTRTHPQPSEFAARVAAANGAMNAYTSGHTSNFQMMVDARSARALGAHFGEFFSEPLLNTHTLEDELSAIDAEHAKNVVIDARRLHRLVTAPMRRATGWATFSTGTRETLDAWPRAAGVDVGAAARAHAARHYADAATMRVSIVGSQSLSELERIAVDAFARVATSEARAAYADAEAARASLVARADAMLSLDEALAIYVPPYDGDVLAKIVYTESVGDARLCVLTFGMPPLHRVASLRSGRLLLDGALEGTHQGAFAAVLSAEGLAQDVNVQLDASCATSMLYEVFVVLCADAPADAHERVVSLFFAYAEALRAQPRDDESDPLGALAAQERACAARLRALYAPRRGQLDEAVEVAASLRQEGATLFDLDAAVAGAGGSTARRLAGYLRPSNARIYVVAPEDVLRSAGVALDGAARTEYFYQTRHVERPLLVPARSQAALRALRAPVTLEAWPHLCGGADTRGGLRVLPLPEAASRRRHARPGVDARLREMEAMLGRGVVPYPRVVTASADARATQPRFAGVAVWHKRDEFFATPRVCVRALLVLPLLAHDAAHTFAAAMFVDEAARRVNEALGGAAQRACVSASCALAEDGVSISIDGFSGGEPAGMRGAVAEMWERALAALVGAAAASTIEIDRAAERAATVARRAARNTRAALERLLLVGFFSAREQLDAAAEARALYHEVARAVCECAHIEVLVHGNVDAAGAASLVYDAVGATLRRESRASAPAAWPAQRCVALPLGTCVHVVAPPESRGAAQSRRPQPQHVYVLLVQMGPATPVVTAATMMLEELLTQPLFAILRTQRRLGYIVATDSSIEHGVAALRVLVQSKVAAPHQLAAHVDEALAEALTAALADTPATRERFAAARRVLLSRDLGREASLEETSDALFGEIVRCGRALGAPPTVPSPSDAARRRAEPHLLLAPAEHSAAPESWPLFDRRFYDIAALRTLDHTSFAQFVRERCAPETRHAAALHVHDAVAGPPPPLAGAIRDGEQTRFQRAAPLAALLAY